MSFLVRTFFSSTVREIDAGVSPAISIHHLGNVGATKSERAGISKLKSDMKMVCKMHPSSFKVRELIKDAKKSQ